MDRKERILQPLDRAGKGLEIGPSHNPVAPRRDGFDVDILDHCDRDGLVAKYRDHGVDLDAIEDVDFVYDGRRYPELTGRREHYDWIIASHVIEHVPDFVAFLNDCDELLREGGVLSLAVPDKRYCFDRLRPLTGLAQLVDAHVEGRRTPSVGQVAEYFLNVVKLNGHISWNADMAQANAPQGVEFVHGLDDAKRGMESVRHGAYLDVHAWCFTPSSFRLLVEDLYQLGLTRLRERSVHDTVGNEFFVSLSRDGAGHGMDRRELVRQTEAEVARCAL